MLGPCSLAILSSETPYLRLRVEPESSGVNGHGHRTQEEGPGEENDVQIRNLGFSISTPERAQHTRRVTPGQ